MSPKQATIARRAADDAITALLELADRLVQHMGTKVAMAQFLFGGAGLKGAAAEASTTLDDAVSSVLQRAQSEGGIRSDIQTADLYFLLKAAPDGAAAPSPVSVV